MKDHEDALDELRTYARNSITDKTINALVRRIKAGFTTPAPIDAEVREALREFIYETTHLSREEPDGSHKCVIPKSTLEKGRAALKKGG